MLTGYGSRRWPVLARRPFLLAILGALSVWRIAAADSRIEYYVGDFSCIRGEPFPGSLRVYDSGDVEGDLSAGGERWEVEGRLEETDGTGLLRAFRDRRPGDPAVTSDPLGTLTAPPGRYCGYAFRLARDQGALLRCTQLHPPVPPGDETYSLRQAAELLSLRCESGLVRGEFECPFFFDYVTNPFLNGANGWLQERLLAWTRGMAGGHQEYVLVSAPKALGYVFPEWKGQNVASERYLLTYYSPDMLSLQVEEESVASDAAHGGSQFRGANLHWHEGRLQSFTIEAMMDPRKPWRQYLGRLCVAELARQGVPWPDQASEHPFEEACFSPDSLHVLFPMYVAAPGVDGPLVARLRYREIIDMIGSHGPLAQVPEVRRLKCRTRQLREPEADRPFPLRWTGGTGIAADTVADLRRLLTAQPSGLGDTLVLTDPADPAHTATVSSHLQYLYLSRKRGYYARSTLQMQAEAGALDTLEPLLFLLSAKPAQESYVAKLDFTAPELGLPLSLIPLLKGDELGDPVPSGMLDWSRFFGGAEWGERWPHELDFQWRDIRVWGRIVCWGDVDHDGLEDVMFAFRTSAREGTGFVWSFPILTRRTPGGPLEPTIPKQPFPWEPQEGHTTAD